MVDAQDLRSRFAARLNSALDSVPGVRKGRGRNVDLFEAIRKNPSAKASTQATHKWLSGESMPGRANMLAIAEWLGVSVEWLAYGDESKRPNYSKLQPDDAQVSETLDALYALRGKVTPRSRKALDSIEKAANEGRLTEDDVLLLERIAQRFESTHPSD